MPNSSSIENQLTAYPNLAGLSQQAEPTRIANRREHTFVDRGELINVRVWDLPGTIGREHLMVDNFQAAVIFYSIGDEQSHRRVTEYVRLPDRLFGSARHSWSQNQDIIQFLMRDSLVSPANKACLKWSPILNSSMAVDGRPIYVVGLKKDLRITTPYFLRLNFEEDHSVSWLDVSVGRNHFSSLTRGLQHIKNRKLTTIQNHRAPSRQRRSMVSDSPSARPRNTMATSHGS